ncbi:ABC transporter substrate-binding protein [Microbacterium saperdae]
MKFTPRRHATSPTLVLAISATLALTLAGCSSPSGETASGSGDTLTVWFPGNSQPEIDLVTDTLVPQFEKENDVDVEVTFVDWGDLSPKLNAAFAAGTAPDVFGHGPAAAADFVANDRVLALDDDVAQLPQADQDDLADSLVGGQVDGTQYLLPLSITGQLVVYRADLLEDAGVDPATITTWEDARAAAEKLTVREGDKVTQAGLLLGSAAIQRSLNFNALIAGEGGSLMSADGSEVEFDSPEGEKALQFFTDLYQGPDAVANGLGNDYLNSPPAQQPLVTGDAAMTVLTSQAAAAIVAANPDLELGVLPALSFEEPAAFGGAGAGLFINADSKAADLSWKFIEFMTSAQISTEYAEGTGTIPIRASAVDSDYVKNSPILQAFLAEVPNYVPNPNVAKWTQIRDVLDTYLEQALNGVATPAEALKSAAAEATSIIGG